MARSGAIKRGVHVPWASPLRVPERPSEVKETPAAASVNLKLGGYDVTDDSFNTAEAAPPHRRTIDPALAALGLPLEPHPTLPDEDRAHLDEDHLVSLAVALDVLSTATTSLQATPEVLQQLVQALIYVGRLGGLDLPRVQALLDFATGEAASRRTQLSDELFQCQSRAAGGEDGASSPTSVLSATRDLERAAHLVVREAVLLLQAHEPIDYKRG